jgi:hypothetical protein
MSCTHRHLFLLAGYIDTTLYIIIHIIIKLLFNYFILFQFSNLQNKERLTSRIFLNRDCLVYTLLNQEINLKFIDSRNAL